MMKQFLVFVEINMKNKLKIILIAFIIGAISSCSAFPINAKLEEMRQLQCRPVDSSGCEGWKT